MAVDSLSLIATALQVTGYYWGLGNLMIPRDLVSRTAYCALKYDCQAISRWCLQYVFDPVRHVLVTMSPFLLTGAGIDRIIAITAPLFYSNKMRRKLAFVIMVITSFILALPVGLSQAVFLRIDEVLVNTTEFGVVPVYKRAGDKKGRESTFGQILSAARSFSKLAGLGGVVSVSVLVFLLFRRQAKQAAKIAPANGTTAVEAQNQQPPLINQRLIVKMMLMQCILVCFSSIPHFIVRINSGQPKESKFISQTAVLRFLVLLTDLGYVSQASFNVFLYAGISRRFRIAALSVFKGDQSPNADNSIVPRVTFTRARRQRDFKLQQRSSKAVSAVPDKASCSDGNDMMIEDMTEIKV